MAGRVPLLSFALLALAAIGLPRAVSAADGVVDRLDPNFVTAALEIVDGGDKIFASAGHAFFRLQCPTYNLDYAFSYEGEPECSNLGRFLAGKLKMGMFSVPFVDFVKQYEADARGITEYRLELPPAAKQRLWKLLDDKVAEGPNLPYDYTTRGCAQSTLRFLFEAIGEDKAEMTLPEWDERYELTQRELFSRCLGEYPWNLFFLNAIVGTEVDMDLPKRRRIIVPPDLVDFLHGVKIAGVPVLAEKGIKVLPSGPRVAPSFFTPLAAASLVLMLAVVFGSRAPFLWAMLAFQTMLGLFLVYMVGFSNLPATDWNWLIIPFNPLPLVFWRWRRFWARPFAALLVIWVIAMIAAPHRLTDPAYYLLALAFAAAYFRRPSGLRTPSGR